MERAGTYLLAVVRGEVRQSRIYYLLRVPR